MSMRDYTYTVGSPDSISTKDLMEKTHISVMIKESRLRWLGHAACRSDINMVKQFLLTGLRGYPGMCNLLDGLVALGCIML